MPARIVRHRAASIVVLAAVLSLGAVSCGGGDGGEGGDGGGTTVAVTLQEFAVLPAASTAPAGSITFDVTNTGPDDVHEFVIFKTDLDPGALPTLPDGSVDEAGEGVELIDEIEDIAVGDAPSLTVDLDAGSYALICNIYDESEQEAHYQEGMFTGFTVE
jgi:iron uptake system component EfeO